MDSSLESVSWSGMGARTSLLGRQEKQCDCLWQRTPFSNVHILGKGTTASISPGVKLIPCSQWIENYRWSDVAYWLDFSSTCSLCLIPQDMCSSYTPWATSGLLCLRGVLHGLPSLHKAALYLTSGRGLLTGPLEIAFNLKMTWNGRKPTSSSAGYSFLCEAVDECRRMSHLHLLSIFHMWQERALCQVLRRAEETRQEVSRIHFVTAGCEQATQSYAAHFRILEHRGLPHYKARRQEF